MTLYAIFDAEPGKAALPAAIPERFSWFAALLPPVFLSLHRLWLGLAVWIVKLVALILLADFIGNGAVIVLYLLLALWLGFAAPGLRRRRLIRAGWRHRGDRFAPSAEQALLEALA